MAAFNPIEGLQANAIIILIEHAADCILDQDLKYKALIVIEEYLEKAEPPSVRDVLNVLLKHSEFEGFVSVAARALIPGASGWQHGEIR